MSKIYIASNSIRARVRPFHEELKVDYIYSVKKPITGIFKLTNSTPALAVPIIVGIILLSSRSYSLFTSLIAKVFGDKIVMIHSKQTEAERHLTFEKIFVEGMLSEQINITDALSHPGETWRVSASWPATSVLLGWCDSPEI